MPLELALALADAPSMAYLHFLDLVWEEELAA
jgi:hypothetical protein